MINWSNKIPEVCAYGTAADYCQLPDATQRCSGVAPLDSLPAAWWNAMWHDNNAAFNCSRALVNNVGQELCNIITCRGGTLNQNCNSQLYSTIFTVGTADKIGMVKSTATTAGAVAIDANGGMSVNGWSTLNDAVTTQGTDIGTLQCCVCCHSDDIGTLQTCIGNAALETTAQAITDAINEIRCDLCNYNPVTYSPASPAALGTASPGTATTVARSNHVHPISCCICAGDSKMQASCKQGCMAANRNIITNLCTSDTHATFNLLSSFTACDMSSVLCCCLTDSAKILGKYPGNYFMGLGNYIIAACSVCIPWNLATANDPYKNIIYSTGGTVICTCGGNSNTLSAGYGNDLRASCCRGFNQMYATGECGYNQLCVCGVNGYNLLEVTGVNGHNCICTTGCYGYNRLDAAGVNGHNCLDAAGCYGYNSLTAAGDCGYNCLCTIGCCSYNSLTAAGVCGYNCIYTTGCCGYNCLNAAGVCGYNCITACCCNAFYAQSTDIISCRKGIRVSPNTDVARMSIGATSLYNSTMSSYSNSSAVTCIWASSTCCSACTEITAYSECCNATLTLCSKAYANSACTNYICACTNMYRGCYGRPYNGSTATGAPVTINLDTYCGCYGSLNFSTPPYMCICKGVLNSILHMTQFAIKYCSDVASGTNCYQIYYQACTAYCKGCGGNASCLALFSPRFGLLPYAYDNTWRSTGCCLVCSSVPTNEICHAFIVYKE